jgi:hypothetical protein
LLIDKKNANHRAARGWRGVSLMPALLAMCLNQKAAVYGGALPQCVYSKRIGRSGASLNQKATGA